MQRCHATCFIYVCTKKPTSISRFSSLFYYFFPPLLLRLGLFYLGSLSLSSDPYIHPAVRLLFISNFFIFFFFFFSFSSPHQSIYDAIDSLSNVCDSCRKSLWVPSLLFPRSCRRIDVLSFFPRRRRLPSSDHVLIFRARLRKYFQVRIERLDNWPARHPLFFSFLLFFFFFNGFNPLSGSARNPFASLR